MPTEAQPNVTGRRLVLIAFALAIAGTLLILSYGYADHSPRPHGVAIAVVAPPAGVERVAAGLQRALPGGFTVTRVASPAAARTALRTQRVRGALVLGTGPDAQVLSAGAAGTALQQVIDAALTQAASAARRQPVLRDVVPLPAGDRGGISSFVFLLGLLIPSVLGSVGLYLVGVRSRLWWRVAAAALFAVLVAGLGTLVLDTALGALTGAWAPMFGIAVLGALSFVLPVIATQATLGLAGTGLMALTFIFLGNAVSGGSVPTGMLPDVYRQISPWLPNGAVVHGIRSVVYFGGHGLGQPLEALSIWSGSALLALVGNDLLHLRERRRTPERHVAEIYATSGLGHVTQSHRRQSAAASP